MVARFAGWPEACPPGVEMWTETTVPEQAPCNTGDRGAPGGDVGIHEGKKLHERKLSQQVRRVRVGYTEPVIAAGTGQQDADALCGGSSIETRVRADPVDAAW